MNTMLHRASLRMLAIAALLAVGGGVAAAPARADDWGGRGWGGDGWRGRGWREHEWREHEWREREWREHHPMVMMAPPAMYAPPPAVVYAPPPVAYMPPPMPSATIVLPLNFR